VKRTNQDERRALKILLEKYPKRKNLEKEFKDFLLEKGNFGIHFRPEELAKDFLRKKEVKPW